MTRNLYLGADLMPVIASLAYNPQTWPAGVPAPDPVPVAAAKTWVAVQATRPAERMAAIAEEIAAAKPAVVGLQEVTTWTTYANYNPADGSVANPTVAYDFLQLLLDALAEEGVVYHEVEGATAHNFASGPIPMITSPTTLGAVEMSDRDVILRRDDVLTTKPESGTFDTIIEFPLADGSVIPVHRGWGSVDVRDKAQAFRFVNAHLEAFGVPGVDEEEIRVGQVTELLAAHEQSQLPVVYVGDYNSAAPAGDAYELLVDSVGEDAWLETQPTGVDGDTCCFDAQVSNPADPLTQRIDLVVVDDRVEPVTTMLVGEDSSDMFNVADIMLWPSDHAGLVATLEIAHPATWRPGDRS
ncbi:MAG TPA: endonuclease/exonuclease/phosphatase family protein [Nocardioidaceae bacterium]|nr:endonuclease/exonuclease/phosphatase family protein [Nocardioidaceae bacterium]